MSRGGETEASGDRTTVRVHPPAPDRPSDSEQAAATERREAAERRHEQQVSREEAARKKAEETKTYSGTHRATLARTAETMHAPTIGIG